MELLSKEDFLAFSKARFRKTIDHDDDLLNLVPDHWLYSELLSKLYEQRWCRIAAGFKSGVYGHPEHKYCIKLLGMGVGKDPVYFVEKGWVLPHERKMLDTFRSKYYNFGPKCLSINESIDFLVEKCGVDRVQATDRCQNHDLILIERIEGVPFATQTGHFLNYNPVIGIFNSEIISKAEQALRQLKSQLNHANTKGLVHNDPMPSNIIFTLANDEITAHLIDFELSQNLNEDSPKHVNISVQELYAQRDVPRNSHTGEYVKNLDQHILDASLSAIHEIYENALDLESRNTNVDSLTIGISILGFSLSVKASELRSYIKKIINLELVGMMI